ncbi:uncharacterized mitochondrial protein-like protein [Tanacetum coccineum]
MVVGESSQPPVKDTTLTFQCPILTSTNYTIWRMRIEVLLGIYREAIKTHNLGADRVKEAKLQTLITEFESLKMLDNGTIDEYASKLSGIASKSATLGEVMSEHKLVKKFLISLPRRFVHIVASLEQVLNHKTTGTEYSNENNDSSEGRGRGLYSRGRGRGQGQGRGRENSQNQGQRDSSKNREDNEQKGKQQEKRDLSHIQCYRCDQYGHFVSKCPERNRNHEVNLNETQEKGVYHEEGTFFMMNHIQETIFINEEKYTPPKSESNTGEDDVWYFNNGASNHMTGNYFYFSELNENITGRVRFRDGSCVSIRGKGSILFQGKNGEQKLLKDVYYTPALRSNGSLLIKVPRNENRLYKAQLKVGKENINEVGRESESKEDHSRIDDTPIPIARLETIRLLIALVAEKGWKIHHLEVKTDFINGDRKKLDSTLKEMGFLQCVHEKAVYRKVPNGEFIIVALTYYLGIEVSQGKDCVEIKQERYVRKILKEAGMEDCNATSYPMEKDLKLSKAEDEPEVEATQYRKVVIL